MVRGPLLLCASLLGVALAVPNALAWPSGLHSSRSNTQASVAVGSGRQSAGQTVAQSGASFVENQGQWNAQAKFLARSKGLNCWLTSDGMVLDFYRLDRSGASNSRQPATASGDVIRLSFLNSRPSDVQGRGLRSTKLNFFHGANTATNVPTFSEARAIEPYRGVNVRYYLQSGAPRYDLQVAPGADPSQIAFRVEGAQSLRLLENGNLEIQTSLGPVEEKGLVAYQTVGSSQVRIPCHMTVEGTSVRFAVGNYDRQRPLIVDPLIFSTYLGGETNGAADEDVPGAMALDSTGNTVVVGDAVSPNFPTTPGAYQTKLTSYQDAYVAKISADGKTLIFGTFIAGSSLSQSATTVALDSAGNPVIAGWTYASDFPTTPNSFEPKAPGAGQMGFVTKFSATGSSLIYSSYLAGGGNDVPTGCALDSSGNLFVTGQCLDGNFPVTSGALQKTENGDQADGFVSKVSANGQSLLYSTYLGGVTYSLGDYPQAIAVDSSGDAIIGGYTWSADFPISPNAYQKGFKGVNSGFITKLNPTGSAIVCGSFLGGTQGASVTAVALDKTGNFYLAGFTTSTDFPVTANAFQPTFKAGPQFNSGFVAELSPNATSLLASTFLSGSVQDSIAALAIDPSGNIVVAGQAQSVDFPVTSNAYKSSLADSEGFVTQLPSDLSSLLYSTFFGGSGSEGVVALSLDHTGNPVFVGFTGSTDLPLMNAYESTPARGFVAKLQIQNLQAISLSLAPSAVTGGTSSQATVSLSPAAPTGGGTVLMTSNGVQIASFSVPAGTTQFGVTLTTGPVSTPATYLIGVSFRGAVASENLTILPPAPASLSVSPATVIGGSQTTGTITLTGKTAVATAVTLSSNNSAISVPTSVTVPAGAISQTFTLTSKSVTTPTSVTVTAKLGADSQSAKITVDPAGLATLSLSPNTVTGGSPSTGKLTLTGPAGTSGAIVTLTNSNKSAVAVPGTVTVPPGASSATFPISSAAVSKDTSVTISAATAGVTKTAAISVQSARLSSLTGPTSVFGGMPVVITVSLTGRAGPAGDAVALTSSSAAISTSAFATIAAGSSYLHVTLNSHGVASSTSVVIQASFAGVTKSIVVKVVPAAMSAFTITPSTVKGGSNVTGEIDFYGAAGAGGLSIKLITSDPTHAVVRATLTVPSGSSKALFTIVTKAISAGKLIAVQAVANGVAKNATFTITR